MSDPIVHAAANCSPVRATSTIVVGYSAKPEGRAALQRAVTEAKFRGSSLIVVHTSSSGELDDLSGELSEAGVPYEIQTTSDNLDPAEELIAAASDERGRIHRDRTA